VAYEQSTMVDRLRERDSNMLLLITHE
jgi:hypothetical protein